MLHKIIFLSLLLIASLPANQRYSGYCQQGGKTVVTSGVSGAPKVQGSYPQCTVTVYLTGTLTLATLFSDNAATPKANPFTANTDGSFFWYAANSRYDVTLSGGGLPAPVTIGDVLLADPSGGGTSVTSFNGRTGAVVPVANDYKVSDILHMPFFAAADYVFTAQTPGGSLIIGSNTITLTPCPFGVTGSDIFHYLYISAGTGTAEPVLITGGTCTSNAATGTVIVTAANTHSGAWTIQTATSGIQEAIVLSKAAGSGQIRAAGTLTNRASVVLPNNVPVALMGNGINATTITLGTGVNMDVVTNENFSTLTGGGTAPAGIYRVTISDLTLDGNKANQSATSWCFRVYGHGYTIRDLNAQNCFSGGLYSEYAVDPGLSTVTTDLEAYWSNIRVKLTGTAADAILFRGPHDSYLDRIVTDDIGGRCFAAERSANYNGNVHLSHFDGYNCAQSATVPACSIVGVAVVGTAMTCSASAAGSHGLYIDGGQSINLTAGNFAALGAGGIGLVLGTATGASDNYIQAFVASGNTAAGSYAVQLGLSSNNTLDLILSCMTSGPGCINNVGDQGGTTIRGVGGTNAQLLVGLALPANDYIQLWSTVAPTVGPQYITLIPQATSWKKYHVVKVANGTNGCVTANGCWTVNNGTAVAASAALTQSITLEVLPVATMVNTGRFQTAVAFTGAATIVANLGNSGSSTLYYAGNYDLKAAVSSSNLVDIRPSSSANTNGAQTLVLALTTTVSNVDQIVTASAVDVWVQWGTLQ